MSEEAGPAGDIDAAGADADFDADFDVVVTGRSLSALQTALDLAEVGLRVGVAGSSEREETLLDEVPLGAASLRDPEGSLAAFIERIAAPIRPDAAAAPGNLGAATDPAPDAAVRRTLPTAPWLQDRAGDWAPQPDPAVLGIPAVPLSRESIALLGGGGAARAHLDRLMPLLTIGKTRSLGALVRRRVGRSVQENLVEPLMRERYGAAADEVDAAIAAPGLNEALSRAGSLTSAVSAFAERFAVWDARIEPSEGWLRFLESVLARLRAFGVVLLDAPVHRIERVEETGAEDGDDETPRWRVMLSDENGDGESRIAARALVIDHPAVLDSWQSGSEAAHIDEFSPETLRVHTEIGILYPSRADEASPRVMSAARSVGEWSMRIAPTGQTGPAASEDAGASAESEASAWRAILRGPRVDSADAPSREAVIAAAAEAVQSAGLAVPDGAEWKIQLRAAPWITEDERSSALRSLRDYADQEPTVLPVGTALHGDDTAESLRMAHEGAVALRRHLLGLIE